MARKCVFAGLIKALVLASLFCSSCGSSRNLQQYLYFQKGIDSTVLSFKDPLIQPNDLLSIQVLSKSLNQEQTNLFNLFNSGVDKSVQQGYQVNADGYVVFPLIGNIKAAGLTRSQLEILLIQKLTAFVKEPAVLVRFSQFNINILGEVQKPGKQTFLTDKVSLVDAISAAGDITDYGRRDNVVVIREMGGKRTSYTINMSDGTSLFQSPGYQLLPNDVVYVSPGKNKLQRLDVNPEAQRRTGLIISLVSVATTITTLIFTIKK